MPNRQSLLTVVAMYHFSPYALACFSLASTSRGILAAKRSHWGVENQLHWVLDIAFREDDSRIRPGHAAENMAILHHMVTNLLKQEHTAKGGIKAKRLQAAWNDDYLLKVLLG